MEKSFLEVLEEELDEGTEKVDGGWKNIGKHGRHSKKPLTKKKADAQRKAMFASGWKG